MMPTSSVCSQLCTPMLVLLHISSLCSFPLHTILSRAILPLPPPKLERNDASKSKENRTNTLGGCQNEAWCRGNTVYSWVSHTWSWESQLPAHYDRCFVIPVIVAHCTPFRLVAELHPSTSAVKSVYQTYISVLAGVRSYRKARWASCALPTTRHNLLFPQEKLIFWPDKRLGRISRKEQILRITTGS